jgi:hypothetical protein
MMVGDFEVLERPPKRSGGETKKPWHFAGSPRVANSHQQMPSAGLRLPVRRKAKKQQRQEILKHGHLKFVKWRSRTSKS